MKHIDQKYTVTNDRDKINVQGEKIYVNKKKKSRQ